MDKNSVDGGISPILADIMLGMVSCDMFRCHLMPWHVSYNIASGLGTKREDSKLVTKQPIWSHLW